MNPHMKDVEISNKTLKRARYFENLKIQNPNYNLVRNDITRMVDRSDQLCAKSKTLINKNKEGEVKDFGLSECNKENDQEIDQEIIASEPRIEKRNLSSLYIDHTSQSPWIDSSTETSADTLATNMASQFESKNDETFNDDIVIFERSEYKGSKAHIENVKSNVNSKSVKVQILYILGMCMILLVATGLFLHFNVLHFFLNYLKIKRKPKPTNYEVSLLFIKNVCEIIYSGVDTVRNVW